MQPNGTTLPPAGRGGRGGVGPSGGGTESSLESPADRDRSAGRIPVFFGSGIKGISMFRGRVGSLGRPTIYISPPRQIDVTPEDLLIDRRNLDPLHAT